jgi:XTP/dITP diphosphohydrolase
VTVVLLDPRRPGTVAIGAAALLCHGVAYTEEVPVEAVAALRSARPAADAPDAPVLVSSDPGHPAVVARLEAGEPLIAAPAPQAGERLIDAVQIMDTLRTAGPWESEQTHDSLRRYLLEETYELFDAVRSGCAEDLRDELGDVLLQVLFHARIAEEAPERPFSIDDVADALIRKLGNRVPAVLAGEQISLEDQLAQWEQRKALETAAQRSSCVDGVPTGQPALALAQKVLARVGAAGVPADLIPAALTTVHLEAQGDAENALRGAVLEFMDAVRQAERSIAAADGGRRVPAATPITAEQWRAHWG